MQGKWGWVVAALSLVALVGVVSSPRDTDPVAAPAQVRPPVDITASSVPSASPSQDRAAVAEQARAAAAAQGRAEARAAQARAAQQAAAARQAWATLSRVEGSEASFEHFDVSVITVRRSAETRLLARVCVRKPPDPSTRTRISWDPWSIDTGSRTLEPKPPSADLDHVFPAEATYRVGQCALGWLVFGTAAPIDQITYANGVGEEAVWDGFDLSAPPETRVAPPEPAPEEEPVPEEESMDEPATDYANCEELNRDYPNGVGEPGADDDTSGSPPVTNFTEDRPLYEANRESDRDDDGVACEKR